jgi:hypothetical protein
MRLQMKKTLILRQILWVIFGLGLIGLVFSFGDLSRVGYEVSKTFWLKWWVRLLVLGLWGYIFIIPNFNLKPIKKKISLSLGLLIAVTLISAAAGVNWQQSLWGNYYRGDGLMTWWHLIILGLAGRWLFPQKEIKKLLPVSLFMSWSLLVIGSWWPEIGHLWQLGFGNPNIAAGFIVVCTPLIIFLARERFLILKIAVFIISMMTVVYLQAWGAVASLGLGLVMFWLLKQPRLRHWVVILLLLSWVGGIVCLMNIVPVGNSQFTESRVRIYHKLSRAVIRRPVFGWGFANVDMAFESIDWPVAVTQDVYIDKAHAWFLEMAVTTGLLGLGIYLFLLGNIYTQTMASAKINHPWTQALLLTFLIYIFHSQTNVTSVAEDAVFWICLGLLIDIRNS